MAKEKIEAIENEEEDKPEKAYVETPQEATVATFLRGRIEELKSYRKNLKIEEKWKEADKEIVPSPIQLTKGKRLEQNQETGARSRLVPIGDGTEHWRSDNSSPTLLTKILTALSIIVDRNPEAAMTALVKKYEKTSMLANGLWKRNWEITQSKEKIKLAVFNLAKYGWAPGRTFPQIIKYKKKVLIEVGETPDGNKYENKELVWFNDVNKQVMDPFKTWIDEMTKPYDQYSMNDCYYELDYSGDSFKVEFEQYTHYESVGKTSAEEETDSSPEIIAEKDKERKDVVTVGFYENRLKDLYCIYIPAKKILLHYSPLPNDDGLLSIWHTLWVLRSATSPYGVSLWELIKGKKEQYDKLSNMTMDQLVLSIYKMFFYTGTSGLFGDGTIKIEPGKGKQITNGTVEWLEVPGPGVEAWEGRKSLKAEIDDDSGITPTLEGQITGKTLGEVLHAKEASLKLMKTPIDNIAWAIEQDAQLALSWMAQIYSTPEIKEFTTIDELMEFQKEGEVQYDKLYGQTNEEGGFDKFKATFYPQMALHLEDRDGELFESKDSTYFQIGKDIPIAKLKWQGIIKISPRSLLAPSEELEKQTKEQLYNMLVPILVGDPNIFSKPAKQLCKVNEEDPKDWLPDAWLVDEQMTGPPLFVAPPGQQNGAPANPNAPVSGNSLQAQAGTAPVQGAPTVVPGSPIPPGSRPSGMLAGIKGALSKITGK